MLNPLEIIQQGDSLRFTFSRGGLSIEGWSLTISVKQISSDTSLITPRIITPDPDRNEWSGILTTAENGNLAIGEYSLTCQRGNSVSDEKETESIRFRVTESLF